MVLHMQSPPTPRTPQSTGALVLCLWVGLFAVAPAHGQDLDRTRFLRWTYQDAGALLQDLGAHAPLVALGGAALLVPSSRFDPAFLEEVQEGYRGPLASYLNVTNELGGPGITPAVAGLFAVSLVTDNQRFQDAAFTSLQSLIYAGATTGVLKEAFGRFRPEAGGGAYRFDPFSGHSSFPSGHTTAAFAIITPWVLYYPNPATYSLFVVSTGTAVARIALDKHWPTDVLAGAAIGFFTARYLTRRHQEASAEGPRFNVALPPMAEPASPFTFDLTREAGSR